MAINGFQGSNKQKRTKNSMIKAMKIINFISDMRNMYKKPTTKIYDTGFKK